MSYYKYAERTATSRVDWSKISSDMVTMLQEQTRLRNEKLDKAQEKQGEIQTKLTNAPMGSDVSANERISNFAADAQEYMLMMNKLWRSGEMSYREYMAATNNFQTNVNGYLGQAENYNKAYEEHVKRMEPDENGVIRASGVEMSELARAEQFGNFSEYSPVIDAPTGAIALVGQDGKEYASVTALGVAVMGTYDRYQMNTQTDALKNGLGDVVRVIRQSGVSLESQITPRDESGKPLRELTAYERQEDEMVRGSLQGDNAHTSVLVDYEQSYDDTHDIDEAANNPNAVLMVPSPRNKNRYIGAAESDVTDEHLRAYLEKMGKEELFDQIKANRDAQREKAVDVVKRNLRSKLNFKEEDIAPEYKPPSAEVIKLQEAAYARSSDLGDWMELLTADKDRQDALANALTQTESAREAGIVKIDPTDPQDVVLHIDTNGDGVGDVTQTVRRIAVGEDAEGVASSLRNWARRGRIIHGIGGDESDRILELRGLTGTVTTPEGEVIEGAELVEASREAPYEAGGFEQPIEDFDTGLMTTTYTQAGGTSEGKTEAVQVPFARVFDEKIADEKIMNVENASAVSRDIIKQAGKGQLDSRYITPISRDAVAEAAPDLGTEEGFVWGEVDVISFFVPEVMEFEVYIPAHQNAKAKLRDLMQEVLLYAQRGEMMSQEQTQNWIDSYADKDLSAYNRKLPSAFGQISAPRQRSRTEAPVGAVPRRNQR